MEEDLFFLLVGLTLSLLVWFSIRLLIAVCDELSGIDDVIGFISPGSNWMLFVPEGGLYSSWVSSSVSDCFFLAFLFLGGRPCFCTAEDVSVEVFLWCID